VLKTRFWKNFDWPLLAVALVLVFMGLLVIYATSVKTLGISTPTDVWHQAVFAGIGLVAMYMLARTDYRLWRSLWYWLYGIIIALLVIVMIISKPVLGATRWINFGFFQFQPSEAAKLVLIIVLARFFADNYDRLDQPKYLIQSLVFLIVPVGLVLKQPDLGTALVLMAIWVSMALVSSMRKLHLGILAAILTAFMPLFYTHLKTYQQQRLSIFLNPYSDPLGAGHNVIQSTITVGSGQLFGRGLGAGTQTQLGFLPTLAQHTDFIFAALAEKMGFIGAILLIILFFFLSIRALRIAYLAQDRFGFFVATGIAGMIIFHALINIGMNMGVAPVTGIPLPFVSYGGTSLLVALGAVGLLESIATRRNKLEFGA
jgi:rod shape determining protein RodA